jgi:sulfatase modifying factor 1
MFSKQFVAVAALAAVSGLVTTPSLGLITIPTVAIGNVGNQADTRVMLDGTTGYGAVAYEYNIGTTEVTIAQYTSFLNAVAATDRVNGLYSDGMALANGGITRTGTNGSYRYTAVSTRANHPVNYVSFWDAARFANWMHNGQPVGLQNNSTTEDGAYTLTSSGRFANTITRNANWRWAITSENEWYKAAFYQPQSQGGDSDNYWLYGTSTNIINGSLANVGNDATTPVGSYAANSNGVFDMAGNLAEWTESIEGTSRVLRGGDFQNNYFTNEAGYRRAWPATDENYRQGFRLTSQIPCAPSVLLLALGGIIGPRRRRHK